jgi:hypothetical protein
VFVFHVDYENIKIDGKWKAKNNIWTIWPGDFPSMVFVYHDRWKIEASIATNMMENFQLLILLESKKHYG